VGWTIKRKKKPGPQLFGKTQKKKIGFGRARVYKIAARKTPTHDTQGTPIKPPRSRHKRNV